MTMMSLKNAVLQANQALLAPTPRSFVNVNQMTNNRINFKVCSSVTVVSNINCCKKTAHIDHNCAERRNQGVM